MLSYIVVRYRNGGVYEQLIKLRHCCNYWCNTSKWCTYRYFPIQIQMTTNHHLYAYYIKFSDFIADATAKQMLWYTLRRNLETFFIEHVYINYAFVYFQFKYRSSKGLKIGINSTQSFTDDLFDRWLLLLLLLLLLRTSSFSILPISNKALSLCKRRRRHQTQI